AHLGLLATATNRIETTSDYPVVTGEPPAPTYELCPGGVQRPLGSRCFRDQYAVALDARWRSPSGDYLAQGQLAASLIENGPPRTLRDGTVLASGDVGLGADLTLGKEGGKHWVAQLGYRVQGRKFDINELGFLRRQNQHDARLDVEYRTLDPGRRTLETHSRLELFDRETLDGLNLARGYQLNTSFRLRNFW